MRDIPRLKAEFFKSLGNPLRIRILELLSEREHSVAEMLDALDAEQSHLSQQLGLLRRAGLVTDRREGSKVLYSLADERIAELLTISKQVLVDILTATRDGLRTV
jgi:ArsR family transcriptional regulator